ncbi:MAG: nucleoside hydrolase [Ferruginibacter sp.]|nr:nucleoside hydrolase [Ferruginibacter sp.]
MKKYFICLTILFNSFYAHAQTKVWFDTDIMIGLPERAPREVDDGVTLIMALKQPQIKIVGISTVTNVVYARMVTEKILNWHNSGDKISIYDGSPKANDLGTENDAVKAMYAALKKEKLTILALGPVTNVATLIKNHPDIIPQIDSIVMCVGRTTGLHFTPGLETLTVFDYNYEKDTASMNVLLKSKTNLVFAGYEPSAYTLIGKFDINFLNKNGSEADQWLFDVLRPWQQRAKILFGVEGFIPYDCATLGIVTHPQYLKMYRDIPVQVNYKENDSQLAQPGIKIKPYLDVSYNYKSKRKVQYAYKVLPGFEEIILETLSQKK